MADDVNVWWVVGILVALAAMWVFAIWAGKRIAKQNSAFDAAVRNSEVAEDAPPKRKLNLIADPIAPAAVCSNCEHFDLEEGQAVMRQNPIFLEAARHVSPNTMMRKLDEHGKELPNENRLKAKEDRWDLFGACAMHEQLRHSHHTCEHFLAREVPEEAAV